LKTGRPEEGISLLRQALQHLPPVWNIDSYEDCLARGYLEVGRLDEAIAEFQRVLRLNPNYALAHYHLGRAHERKGRADQARAEYERFLRIWKDADPDIPELMASKKRLAHRP
jgi:tetratricopeptide (TPR) repeat protein